MERRAPSWKCFSREEEPSVALQVRLRRQGGAHMSSRSQSLEGGAHFLPALLSLS